MHKGSCLCGAVSFEVNCELPPPSACHCRECRKHSGHFEASADVPRSAVTIKSSEHITWYHSSNKVRRGFCKNCGSSLFWDPIDQQKHDWTAISLGAFDTATNTKLKQHIFVAEKGDYYEITDGLPQIMDPRKCREPECSEVVSDINHITLSVIDLNESFEFYTKTLGLKPLALRKEKSAYLLAGNDWITLVKAKDPNVNKTSYAHLAFSVTPQEFKAVSERIRSSGSEIWQDNSSPSESLYFLDPSGNKLEIHVGNWQSRIQWLKENHSSEVELFV